MITDAELAAMRGAQEAALPTAATIQRRTLVDAGDGTYSETWATTATMCRIAALSARELEIAARLNVAATFMVTLPYDADVRGDDRIVAGGRTLRVTGILSGGSWETARRVWAIEAA